MPCLTLVLPGMDWPQQTLRDLTCDLPTPGLSALLEHGELSSHANTADQPWPAIVRAALNTNNLPAAAACRLLGLGSAPDSARWVCLDPLNLSILQHRMLINDPAGLELTMDEAAQLAVPLAPTFAPLGELHITTPTQWHLKLNDAAPSAGLPALATAIGHSAEGGLSKDRSWRSALNEAQMVLHQHPVNQARSERGQPVINSLWPWGDGRLPPVAATHSAQSRLYAAEPMLRGQARHLGIHHEALPMHWNEIAAGGIDSIIVIDTLHAATRARDGMRWRDALAALDANWFQPIFTTWQQQTASHITLLMPAAQGVRKLTLTENSLSMRMLNQVRQWFPRDKASGLERLATASEN